MTIVPLRQPNRIDLHNAMMVISFMGILLLLASCTPISDTPTEANEMSQETLLPTPETISLATPLPLPDFLSIVFPEPGSTYTLAEFDELTERYGSIAASGEVFLSVRIKPLLEVGDFFDTVEEFFPRINVIIDGQPYPRPQSYIRTDAWHQTYLDPDTREPLYQVPAGTPFRLYYHMEREPGLHTVEVEIRKTSGEVVSYAWWFVLTD